MFLRHASDGYADVLPGIRLKTLVYGEKTLMSEFRLAAGRPLPLHRHPHEQTGYLVSGKIRLTIGNDTFDVSPGDGWCIREGVDHGAEVIEDAVAIEVFSPVREDYLPENLAPTAS